MIFILFLSLFFVNKSEAHPPSTSALKEAKALVTVSEALLTKAPQDFDMAEAEEPILEAKALLEGLPPADLTGAKQLTQIVSGPRCQATPLEELTSEPSKDLEAFGRERALEPFYVFVTLSMTDATLKALYRDVQKIGGRLVIRGLLENDFKKTQARLLDLTIGVDIDPPLFQKFQVTRVPTFLHVKAQDGETVHDRLRGNVTVAYALSQFAERGEVSGTQELIDRLGGGT